MPEPTYLQIQGGDTEATRIFELPGSAIRVGRGALCEVRLSDPDLAEVQCLLRRRGKTWHVQPIGPADLVSIEGSAIDHIRPLPAGVPLRVGSFRLLIKQEGEEYFREPIEVGGTSDFQSWDSHSNPILDPTTPHHRRTNGPAEAASGAEHLRSWQGRIELRERWLQTQQEKKKWEARWRAAGEGLRARVSPPRSPVSPPQPRRVELDSQEEPRREISQRVSSSFMNEGLTLLQSYSGTTNIPSRSSLGDSTSPIPATGSGSPSMALLPEVRSLSMTENAERTETESFHECDRETALPRARGLDGPADGSSTALRILSETGRRLNDPPRGSPAGCEDLLPRQSASCPKKEDLSGEVMNAGTWSHFFDPPPVDASWHSDAILSETIPTRDSNHRSAPNRSAPINGLPPSPHSPSISHRVRADYPDAVTIFAAQGRRDVAQPSSTGTNRGRGAGFPVPTEPLEPDVWTLPTWVVLPPTSVVAVGVIGIGLLLAMTWTIDNQSAGLAIRAALRAEDGKPVPLDPTERVDTRWWKTTAVHLSLWSAAIERSPEAASRSDEVREAIDSAHRAAPLEVAARYALAQPIAGDGTSTDAVVGLSRDVASLTLTGRMLIRSGRIEPALRAYRRALELAIETGAVWLDPPTFDEDPAIRRFRLPHEQIVGIVIRDMVSSRDWSFAEWSVALPANSVVRLAAGRILREKSSPDAARAFGLALADDVAIPEATDPAAEHYAAQAEALVLTEKRDAAADRYRKAIAMTSDDGNRRRWRLALAEILAPLGDTTERADLLQAAIGDNPADEVGKKALDALQFAGMKRVGSTQMPLRSENGR